MKIWTMRVGREQDFTEARVKDIKMLEDLCSRQGNPCGRTPKLVPISLG